MPRTENAKIPPPGGRGPRRELARDEATLQAMAGELQRAQRDRQRAQARLEQATARETAAARTLHEAGLSVGQVATLLGVSRSAAQKVLDRHRDGSTP